jgi:hypothetical protein
MHLCRLGSSFPVHAGTAHMFDWQLSDRQRIFPHKSSLLLNNILSCCRTIRPRVPPDRTDIYWALMCSNLWPVSLPAVLAPWLRRGRHRLHLLNTEKHIRSYSEVSAACAVVSMLDATCESSVSQKATRSKGALRLMQHVPMSLLHRNIFRDDRDNMYDVVVCGQVTVRCCCLG